MFPIQMKHIGKSKVVRTAQVFGYSAKRVDEHTAADVGGVDATYLSRLVRSAADRRCRLQRWVRLRTYESRSSPL